MIDLILLILLKADLTDYNTCLNNIKKAKDAEKEGKKEEEARKAAELKKIEDAVRFSVRLMDEDEVPSEIEEKVVNQNTSSIPTEAVEMMKHLPQELRDNFERLWNNQHKRNVKIPGTTDTVTRSMTTKGNVKALAVKSTKDPVQFQDKDIKQRKIPCFISLQQQLT